MVSRLPLAPDVTQLVVELEDARPYAWLPGRHVQLLLEDGSRRNFHRQRTGRRYAGLLASVAYSFGRHNCEPRCFERHDVGRLPHVASTCAMRPGRSGWSYIRRMPGGVFTTSCRAWRRAMR